MFSKDFLTEEAIDELIKITKIEKEVNRDDLIYKTSNKKKDKMHDFQKFERIRSFGRENYNYELTPGDALEEQINLKNEIYKFKESIKPQNPDKKENEALTYENANTFLRGRQKLLNGCKSKIFPIRKQTQGKDSFWT